MTLEEMKEKKLTEEQLQCRKQYTCTPYGILSPAKAIGHGHACAPNPYEIIKSWCFEPVTGVRFPLHQKSVGRDPRGKL